MKIQNVGIIGQGFVGSSLLKSFEPHYNVYSYDKFKKDLSTHKSIYSMSRACELIFVCVPTPEGESG